MNDLTYDDLMYHISDPVLSTREFECLLFELIDTFMQRKYGINVVDEFEVNVEYQGELDRKNSYARVSVHGRFKINETN